MVTKTEAMQQASQFGSPIEQFEHELVGKFNVTATRKVVEQLPQFLTLVDIRQMIPFLTQYVIDQERVKQLSEQCWRNEPAIIVEQDGKHYLIDGVHRTFRRRIEGMECVIAYIIPIELAVRMGDPDNYIKFDWQS